ncbi:hypothetical protein [Gaetbulibacter sp. PBL-D1]|uniref:hypothetical protein n=1 Tax=Gaetbulibacter sp. PBL-D1 TaxID=3422594 RepID=UPI003D2EDF0F
MAQLGYTFYPKDWFTSNTRKRLKRFPLVRYTIREIIDLINMESGPIDMNREYLMDDLDIELTDIEYEKLMEFIEVMDDGRWYLKTVKKRISKAEAARENGKKGGRPPKKSTTPNQQKNSDEKKPNNPEKKPNPITQKTHLYKEKVKEKEKYKVKEKVNNAHAIQFLKSEKQIEYSDFEMQNKKQVHDWNMLLDSFNDTVDIEISQGKIEMLPEQLMPRLRKFTRSWITNQQKPIQQTQQHSNPPDRY